MLGGRQRSRLMSVARTLVATLLLLLLPGCGGGDEGGGGSMAPPAAGGGGELVYAVPGLPPTLDPLAADGTQAQVVTRQVYEPLVTVQAGPYGGERARMGLATALRPSADHTVWTVQLRGGVRFTDGTSLNAAAVRANARRWASVPAGQELLPDLFAVDAPRPGVVRFQLERPAPDLPRLLADPRLGIVSPRALRPQSGESARYLPRDDGSGTGPFRPASRRKDIVELDRNPAWWGSPLGFGPALDSAAFIRHGTVAARAAALREGEAQVAGPLPPALLRSLASDPLLSAVPGLAGGLATEASVRGLDPALPLPLLSGVWLTTIAGKSSSPGDA
jgi:peptide/nickel transport system substrate-binding protein